MKLHSVYIIRQELHSDHIDYDEAKMLKAPIQINICNSTEEKGNDKMVIAFTRMARLLIKK